MLSGTFLTNPLWLAVMVGCGICSGAIARWDVLSFWRWFLLGLVFGSLAVLFLIFFVIARAKKAP